MLKLVKTGVLNYSTLSKARPYVIVVNLILGVLLTTPEIVTQILMFIPLQLLFETAVWIAWYREQPDRSKARRRVVLVVFLLGLLIAGLVWAGYEHYGPAGRPYPPWALK
jgi:Sec-independent protein translocase protein (TatC)